MNNPWVIGAVVVVFALVIGVWLWWHGKKAKAMQQKPQPKKDQGSK